MADILRIFVQHYAVDIPIRTFLALKQTCRAIADVCRSVEPGCHWRRFEQHMSDYVPDWYEIRDFVRAPGVIVSYNDEVPFCAVTIMNCKLPEGCMFGYCMVSDGRVGFDCIVDNMHKFIEIRGDIRPSEMRLTRNGLRIASHDDSWQLLKCVACYDAYDDVQLDDFINNVVKYSEQIKSVETNILQEDVTPPYQTLKAVLYYDGIAEGYASMDIEYFLFFAGLDNSNEK